MPPVGKTNSSAKNEAIFVPEQYPDEIQCVNIHARRCFQETVNFFDDRMTGQLRCQFQPTR
jgi:hypothetical protein